MKTPQRILVVRTDRIGDVVLTLPVVMALRRRYPEAHLAMLVAPEIASWLEGHPALNEVLIDGPKTEGLKGFFRLVKRLRKRRYDAVLLVHPTLRLATALWLARIPLRIGTAYRVYAPLFNRRVAMHRRFAERHEVEMNLRLAAELDVPPEPVVFGLSPDPAATERVRLLCLEIGVPDRRPRVVIHPGSRGSALDWPIDRFAALAERLVCEKGAAVLLTGGPGEEALIADLMRRIRVPVFSLAGRLDLKALIALLAQVDLVVANSTGPLHIAAALGTQVIGLYPPLLPAHPRRWGPWGQPENVVMATNPGCSPCGPCHGKKRCMETIRVEDVWSLVERLL